MTRALFRCDGARVPDAWRREGWDIQQALDHRGPAPNVYLSIENLSHALMGQVESHAADLIRIAAYVFAADQRVSRGGKLDVHARRWRRQMALVIPVTDPDFWRRTPTGNALKRAADFASEDDWAFAFTRAEPEAYQLRLNMPEQQLLGEPDSVALFSGGADSLSAIVEAVTRREARPILVSHTTNPAADSTQKRLAAHLRSEFPQWGFPHLSVWIHLKGADARDASQRSRPLVFSGIAASIAQQLGVAEVLLSDNGGVSLNLPINDQLIGALASRSTHPKFIAHFNELADIVWPGEVRVANPLWSRTRREALEVLKDAGVSHLLASTLSCVHTRRRPKGKPQCGVCSQCVDRRFATIGAGLEKYDRRDRYGTDIFRDALCEADDRTMAESYCRFARRVLRIPPDQMIDEIPQLVDCIVPERDTWDERAWALIDMLQHHAQNVINVLSTEIDRAKVELAAESLPDSCLLRLVVGPQELGTSSPARIDAELSKDDIDTAETFQPGPDYRWARFHGEDLHFTTNQARLLQVLHEIQKQGTREVSEALAMERADLRGSRMRDVFRRHRAWGTLVVRGSTQGTVRLDI